MANFLNDEFNELNADELTAFQIFQKGATVAAVSMRDRALKVVDGLKLSDNDKNAIKNGIGSLSDFPQ